MPLPIVLQRNFEQLLGEQNASISKISLAANDISFSYRQSETHKLDTQEACLAYIGMRLPATYSVTEQVLQELKTHPQLEITSLLELGAGAGVALWAVEQLFPSLQEVTIIEQNPQLIGLGKQLTTPFNCPIHWKNQNLLNGAEWGAHDLVVMSYVSGELTQNKVKETILKAYKSAKQAFIIIEPGTPRGFERLLKIRQWLLEAGGHIIAPCSHQGTCPMQGKDWCHFSVRLKRTVLHQKLKEADLPYEDEKYSYLIVTPHKLALANNKRILKNPLQRSGHVVLDLCATNAIDRQVITKKARDLYRAAKKASWGEVWPQPPKHLED